MLARSSQQLRCLGLQSHIRCCVSLSTIAPHLPSPPVLPARTSFESLGIHSSIQEALSANDIIEPTGIQTQAAPLLLARNNTVIAAETGAGKTIAYLAPILSSLKHSELHPNTNGLVRGMSLSPMRPSIIVLVPTRELSSQVFSVSKLLSHIGKFRVRAAVGGPQSGQSRKRLRNSPVDMIVGTPGSIENMRNQQLLYLSRVSTIVLDEADELVSTKSGFGPQLTGLMNVLRERDAQFVYSGATVPQTMESDLRRWHAGNLEVARGSRLHRATPSSRVKTTFIRVDGSEDAKLQKLVEVFSISQKRTKSGKVLIFCDNVKRRETIVQLLRSRGTDVVHLSGEGRNRNDRNADWDAFSSGQVWVAVCSKSFSRGIDDHEIDTVILFDVPMTGSEYLHRVGRIRGTGRAYVLVGRRELAIAEELFLSHVKGLPVAGVSPQKAWKEYTNAGRDRIATDKVMRMARSKRQARWVDERLKADGTYRGRKRKIMATKDENEEGDFLIVRNNSRRRNAR
ncbi:RNA helicase [Gracilaria domingensis]|nr:RNA helicase [Gracilaria domingensis]